jgi:hypothetical protein
MQVLANLLVREVITLFSNLIFSISCVIIDWHTLKVFHAYIVTFPQQGAGNHLVGLIVMEKTSYVISPFFVCIRIHNMKFPL